MTGNHSSNKGDGHEELPHTITSHDEEAPQTEQTHLSAKEDETYPEEIIPLEEDPDYNVEDDNDSSANDALELPMTHIGDSMRITISCEEETAMDQAGTRCHFFPFWRKNSKQVCCYQR